MVCLYRIICCVDKKLRDFIAANSAKYFINIKSDLMYVCAYAW